MGRIIYSPSDPNNTVGEKIKIARKSAGLTQKELAKRAGISMVSVQQYERGVRNPQLKQLSQIAAALNKNILDFLSQSLPTPIFDDILQGVDNLQNEVNKPRLLEEFDKLNATGQEVALERVSELTQIPMYQKKKSTAKVDK